MNEKEISDFRRSLKDLEVRITNLALSIHKEQERIGDLVRIIDSYLIKEKKCQ